MIKSGQLYCCGCNDGVEIFDIVLEERINIKTLEIYSHRKVLKFHPTPKRWLKEYSNLQELK